MMAALFRRRDHRSIDRKRDLFQMANELRSIRIIIPWFGPWPAWMRCFIESCRWNPTVDWLLFGDAPPPDDLPPNLRIVTIGFADYRGLVASRLGINLEWTDAYKLCDVKPALGFIHEPAIAGYDYWGYGDLDVIYGNIRHFFKPQVLTNDLVTTHEHIVAGHLTVMRTTPRMLTAFSGFRDGGRNCRPRVTEASMSRSSRACFCRSEAGGSGGG
jgi:hypothetical protein